LILLIFGGFFKCQEFALAKGVESVFYAKMGNQTIIGIFAVLIARMPTNGNGCRLSDNRQKPVPVLCADTKG
jgi:hypothetical protein